MGLTTPSVFRRRSPGQGRSVIRCAGPASDRGGSAGGLDDVQRHPVERQRPGADAMLKRKTRGCFSFFLRMARRAIRLAEAESSTSTRGPGSLTKEKPACGAFREWAVKE